MKFNQIRAGRKFIYRQNTSVTTRAKHGLTWTLLQTSNLTSKHTTFDSQLEHAFSSPTG